ncbi:hypothetical protein JCM17380_08030 [Desulfosporosinus burensis]
MALFDLKSGSGYVLQTINCHKTLAHNRAFSFTEISWVNIVIWNEAQTKLSQVFPHPKHHKGLKGRFEVLGIIGGDGFKFDKLF